MKDLIQQGWETADETTEVRYFARTYKELRNVEKLLQSMNVSKWTQDHVRGMRRRMGESLVAAADALSRGDAHDGDGRAE